MTSSSSPIKVIGIIGPTAVGKTELAFRIAQYLPCEVISLDSALVYRYMDIGTAKPSLQKREQLPHHLIDIISPMESYHVANFVKDCRTLIKEIHAKNKIALIVGGTMMYYHALMYGLSNLPPTDPTTRNTLALKKKEIGLAGLYEELTRIDPVTARNLSEHDSQRIERALAVYYISGKPMSQLVNRNAMNTPYVNRWPTIALTPEKKVELHHPIEQRFQQMLSLGMIDEVQALKTRYPLLNMTYPALRAVGYRQVWQYLHGELNKEEMVEKAIIATRQLAKHQITWLKRLPIDKVLRPQEIYNIHYLLDKWNLGI